MDWKSFTQVEWARPFFLGACIVAAGCGASGSSNATSSAAASTIASEDPSEQLERFLLGGAFSGIDAAYSAYDMGKLQFLTQAFDVIGNLPYDPRIQSFVQQGNDLWFPIFCTRLVMLERVLGLPTTNDGTSQCLAQIEKFESSVGTLIQVAEADLQNALALIPGASFAEKLQNLATFYANFGGPGSSIDDKVTTAIALGRVYADYQQSANSSGGVSPTAYINVLVRNEGTLLKEAQALAGSSGYLDRFSYQSFFQQIDTSDLRTVIAKFLAESGASSALVEVVLDVYDNNFQTANNTFFTFAYNAGQEPYASILQQFGVQSTSPPSFTPPAGQPGGTIKLSDLISLWNQAFDNNSPDPYRDIFNAFFAAEQRGALVAPPKSVSVRTGFLRRFDFPRGLPVSKLVNAIQSHVLPLDLVVSSTPDGNTVVIQ
jgi:hypothetical protein